MDTSEVQPPEPEETSSAEPASAPPAASMPSAMPLSMPPMGPATPAFGVPVASDTPITEPTPTPVTEPVAAMPLSMPPWSPPPSTATAEYPPVAPGAGNAPPPPPASWAPAEAWSDPQQPSDSASAPPRRPRRALAVLAAATVLAGGLGAGLGVAFSSNSSGGGSGPLAAGGKSSGSTKALSAVAIYKLVSPAVVDINTVVSSPSSSGSNTAAAGTGMIVSSNGVILTNNHVIKHALRIEVTIAGHSGTYAATVLGTSANDDIALIKVNGLANLPTVTFGDSSAVQIGESAVAVGNAEGLGGSPSLAPGSISALGRTINAADEDGSAAETLHNLIETNALIQPGDSGGPLLNSAGQVIGIDTAASSGDVGSSVGFAIPINQAKAIAVAIEQGKVTTSNGIHVGLSPYFGVYGQTTGTSTGNGFGYTFGGTNQACSGSATNTVTGAQISDVSIDGPAATAGITSGDTITAVNGVRVKSYTALANQITKFKPGAKISVAYTDGCGTSHTTTLTVGGTPA